METDRKNRHLKRLLSRTLPLAALLAALLVALFLVSDIQLDPRGTSNTFLDDGYIWVFVVTVIALVILFLAIAQRLLILARRVRAEEPGARLAARWVRNFLALSLPPALIVYFFSAWFLSSTIDSWFDVRVEAAGALADAGKGADVVPEDMLLDFRVEGV